MRAEEARKLTKLYHELDMVYGLIKKHIASGNPQTCIKIHLSSDVKESLREMEYKLSDDIDEDSDYRGTWISW